MWHFDQAWLPIVVSTIVFPIPIDQGFSMFSSNWWDTYKKYYYLLKKILLFFFIIDPKKNEPIQSNELNQYNELHALINISETESGTVRMIYDGVQTSVGYLQIKIDGSLF